MKKHIDTLKKSDLAHYLEQLHDLKEVQAIEEFTRWVMVNDKSGELTPEDIEEATQFRGQQIAREMFESYNKEDKEEEEGKSSIFLGAFDLPKKQDNE